MKLNHSFFLGANELYGQCGNGDEDHSYWGRASEYYDVKTNPNPRDCYKIDSKNPGADLASETAAALASASIVFKGAGQTEYGNTLLRHAKELFDFAINHPGKYSDSISDAASFYRSWSGYEDELVWAAAWLYKASGEQIYLNKAESLWKTIGGKTPNEFSWDNKIHGAAVLLAQLSSNPSPYKENADNLCNHMQTNQRKTKRGIVFIQEWGSNRHAANVAFICLTHSKATGVFNEFGREQIDLMLGDDNKRSFVVGYGNNPPHSPHHRASSCPTEGSCSHTQLYSSEPNPQILYGALIGGVRNTYADFTDDRQDYVTNEVAIDYNAGFQSAMAALLNLQKNGDCGK